MLEEAHGIDSTRFHLVANHLDTKKDQHRAASEYRFSWASEAYSVVDARSACGSVQCRLGWPCREDQGSSDRDAVCAVLRRTEPARDRNEPAEPRGQTLPSRRQHHIAIGALDRQCFASCEVFAGLLSALMAQLQAGYRRKIGDCVRLIDSTSVQLSGLSGDWATFSAGVCGAKAHIIYDPDADQPLYLMVTPSNVNDITAAKEMPIEAGATYVFDLGYYDYGWWATLDQAGCRIVTRLKSNTPFTVVDDLPVPPGSSILSDRTGYLPNRLAASRKNPMSGLVREVQVMIETGKVLRIFTNDLEASAQEIADLYKRRWAIELFFRWVKQTLKIIHFLGTSENAVRIQIAVALIAFLLLRLAHDANKIVAR